MAIDRRTFMRLASAGIASAVLPLEGCVKLPTQYGSLHYPTPEAPLTPTEAWYFVGIQGLYQADMERYRVKIAGLVNKGLSLSIADLEARYETRVMPDTMACVGNRPGGTLFSTSYFRGVRMRDVLEDAGYDKRATTVVTTGLDGFAAFRTLDELLHPDTMLAFEMGTDPDELLPLPVENGFPLRLLTPGHYGYLQAKWIDAITLTDDSHTHTVIANSIEYFDGKIQLASGFSNPRHGWGLQAGPNEIVGYAFGDGRPIDTVEVHSSTDGEWREAEIAWNGEDDDEMPDFVWCLWRVVVDLPDGTHTLAVRATYRDGQSQFNGRDFPYSGGTIHTIDVTARGGS